jgi:hypothetical protein
VGTYPERLGDHDCAEGAEELVPGDGFESYHAGKHVVLWLRMSRLWHGTVDCPSQRILGPLSARHSTP